jgi:ketosteroid isomerase-like protein
MPVLGKLERLAAMPTPDPKSYADQWVHAWNAHDVEAVLDHFHDDVVFTSPVAARVVPESGGVVRGKAATSGTFRKHPPPADGTSHAAMAMTS